MAQQTITANTRDILKQAHVAHYALGLQLRAAAYDENRAISVRHVRDRSKTPLAQLLMGLCAQGRNTPKMREVDMLHAEFHDAAGAVATLINAGLFDEAIDELATGYFAEAASDLSRALCYFGVEIA
ncbi:hypothetical protein SAMN04488043_12310 [Thalassovita gelatinovora]|uniref:hypothetical protein n=1 Tax=Thalassovita gelatinovora TaxID=53501 RepID=UPI0008C48CA3|nr:hypothetical protein [Thalassovita gelatinovora]QIZ80133.1 hypothetical protein HFZ77_06420 [Thalassovita gelatinovora]QIZ80607.1 hypothetical protein HFZ77_08985 [Thalassovita gelatinovora]SEQ77828.1 hypothetical protein SAMN04488043_108213 [Thalassovita gelatinovora]SER21049.1 hypothetical protein SAMN04488043_12310 [Thalassovita gelatinovora]